MKFKNILTYIILSALSIPTVYAQNNKATNSTKSTALLVASCQITAQTVNFGALILPVTNQTATSNLKVTCSKSAPYSITMGTTSNLWLINANGSGIWYVYNSTTNTRQSLDTLCGTQAGGACATANNYKSVPTTTTSTMCSWPHGCSVWKGSSNYSVMTGATKGDSVAYAIQHPTNAGIVWNSNNPYNAIGTGANENIAVVAKLIPASSTSFPAPDNYSDTVTTQINF